MKTGRESFSISTGKIYRHKKQEVEGNTASVQWEGVEEKQEQGGCAGSRGGWGGQYGMK